MAIEGVDITPGSGKTVAVDTINVGGGNKEFQILKFALGAEDALDLLVDSGQQVMNNSIPVVLPPDQTPIPVASVRTSVTITPTISITAYEANDCIGGKQTLANAVRTSGGSARLNHIRIIDEDNQKPDLAILVLNADPTSATLTNHSAIVWNGDQTKVELPIRVPTSSYMTVGSIAFVDVFIDENVKPTSGTSLWVVIMCFGLPDFSDINHLTITFYFDQD